MNNILIKIALYLLDLVNESEIEHKNSWRHYKNEIRNFIK